MPVWKVFGMEEKQAVMDLFDLAIAEGSHFLGYNGPQEEAYCREFADFLGVGFAEGTSALSWSAAGISHLAPPLPEADATDANHFRLSFHEGWSETEAADVAAALCKVAAAFRRS